MDEADTQRALDKQREYVRRIMDETYMPGYQTLFLDLSEEAILNAEILFGPLMSDSEKILLTNYFKTKGLKNYGESSLRIQ